MLGVAPILGRGISTEEDRRREHAQSMPARTRRTCRTRAGRMDDLTDYLFVEMPPANRTDGLEYVERCL